ncbi:MAG: tRNA (adenosine(37)-N6)-threonylcarbamoyltransferase complex ATPase subunit type 1 TsaE [Kiritimatiellaeota bacterium]|nr:tRNA (adenosine(37)-N6)-threonylcarbamoyltransferase complex ATPase subunit type 1 TsaE [Kiritimatiellota bacterium]
MKTRKVISKSPEETQALAAALVAELSASVPAIALATAGGGSLAELGQAASGGKIGAVLALHGELGSGKTCFVQGLARALGVRQPVTSPTFTIVNEYRGRCPLVHMDLYRISDPDELLSIDFENYLDTEGITVIEWAERAGSWLPENTMHIYFETGPDLDKRTITMAAGAPV